LGNQLIHQQKNSQLPHNFFKSQEYILWLNLKLVDNSQPL
jgi:hypothetical protein